MKTTVLEVLNRTTRGTNANIDCAMNMPRFFTKKTSFQLAAALVLCAALSGCESTHEDALAAFNSGEYAEASTIWSELAKEKNANAQMSLGRMYELGIGKSQDYARAIYWYRLAAAQNNPYAQGNLAVLLAMGQGAEQDLVQSYVLSTLAARNYSKWAYDHQEAAMKNRELIIPRMTSAQIAEAQRKVIEWKSQADTL